jgi:hypothetical protein
MASATESKLSVTQYSGEKRNFDLEFYVRIPNEQHYVLNGLV